MTNRLSINNRSNGGDCLAVRQTLDLAHPGEPDSPAVAEATRHVESCPACQAIIRRHEQWDAQLSTVCRDVPVPADLAARLLLALESAAAAPPTTVAMGTDAGAPAPTIHHSPLTPLTRPLRRRRLMWCAAAAACALVAGGSWYLSSRPTIDLDTLISRVAADELSVDQFPLLPDATAPLPAGSMNGRVVFDLSRQLPERKTAAERKVTVYFFELPATRSGKAVHGALLVVPVSMVAKPPSASMLLGSPAVYPGRNSCASSWVEGDVVYVCLVKGGEDSLHRLRPARPVAI